jgi:3-hydroxyacyl-CoA dehydrogenase/enoyl-CoA hydratase/3-hydroxybutyryl-CoA epimerase
MIAKHWKVKNDLSGISWLSLDKAGSSANVLSSAVLKELSELIGQLELNPSSGVVIKSNKDTGFILGADIEEFVHLNRTEEAEALVLDAHNLFARIEALPCPTVALINGLALGGGLELALACDYRVVADTDAKSIGFPEVQLGIHPGFGGTVRSVRILGALVAMDLMLSGRLLSPQQALNAGLVTRLVEGAKIETEARNLIALKPPKTQAPFYLRLLNLKPCRFWLGRHLKKTISKRAQQAHYPAPYSLIDLWIRYGGSVSTAYYAEAKSISKLLFTPTAKNLIRVYFLRQRLSGISTRTSSIKRVHVIGAGVMGANIAAWCGLKNLVVTVQDSKREVIESALTKASSLFKRRLKNPIALTSAYNRLQSDPEGEAMSQAGIVIEAIIENLDAKKNLFEEIENRLNSTSLLTTNTSSIDIEKISKNLKHPERFVGVHFFNPVDRLPLVEVIRSDATDEHFFQEAIAFVRQIGKLPLPCRSTPGFVVNRVLAPYMLEALIAYQEGNELETIDEAAIKFGMPTGPIELADRVGLDIALNVTRILSKKFSDAISGLLVNKVNAGNLGVKTGQGFYTFSGGRPKKKKQYAKPNIELQDRLILALVNEAMACSEDGVVEDLDLIDAGVVFGTGFAPFRGGPIQYARERGIRSVIDQLELFENKFGTRFKPNEGWQKLL